MSHSDAFEKAEAAFERQHHRELNVSPKDRAIQAAITKKKKKTATITIEAAPTPKPVPQPDIHEEDDDSEEVREVCFDYYCVPVSDVAKGLIESVWADWLSEMRKTRWKKTKPALQSDLDDFRRILSTTLANIMYAVIMGTNESGVYITRNTAILSTKSRYRPMVFNRKFLTVVDGLRDMGLLFQQTGKQWTGLQVAVTGKPVGPTARTVIRGTKTLRNLMEKHKVEDVQDIEMERELQEVTLLKKDSMSGLIEYQDIPLTHKFRQDTKAINAMLKKADITVVNKPGLVMRDPRQRFQQRQFTYGSFESGGRFKGGFWYAMSKAERYERMQINGESVVELDYHAMLPHLLYAKVGQLVPSGDQYHIQGLSPESREGIKRLVASITFDRSMNRTRFPKKVGELFSEGDRRKGVRYAISMILAHHKAIAHLFGKGLGHYLQFQESQLMVAVLLDIKEHGFIGLPVHDCLIVPRSQAHDVQARMESVAEEILKVAIPVKQQSGLSSIGSE